MGSNGKSQKSEKLKSKKNLPNSSPDKKLASGSIDFESSHSYLSNPWSKLNDLVIELKKFWSVFLVIGIFGFFFLLKLGEEQYSVGGRGERHDLDFYKILEVPRKSSQIDVKKAFRKLSLRWHPDKNVGCEACVEKFRLIGTAYEVLGDIEKRKIYDSNKGDLETIPSQAQKLSSENYYNEIYASEKVVVLQIYSDHEELCHYFSRIWEEGIDEFGQYYKFMRVNVMHDSKILKLLPVNIKVYPAVFILAPDYYEVYNKIINDDSQSFADFLVNNYPTNIQLIDRENNLKTFLEAKTNKPKLIYASNKSNLSLLVKSITYKWSKIFEIAAIDQSQSSLNSYVSQWNLNSKVPNLVLFDKDSVNPSKSLLVKPESSSERSDITLNKKMMEASRNLMPYINSHNGHLLCESNKFSRVFCLFMINVEDGDCKDSKSINSCRVSDELLNSYNTYLKTHYLEAESDMSDEFGHQESLWIQPVRISTTYLSEEIPNYYYVNQFMKLWNTAFKKSKFVLMDIDGDRYSVISNTENLYDAIVNEDLFWFRVPEGCSTKFISQCLYNSISHDSYFKRMKNYVASFSIISFVATALCVIIIYFAFSMLETQKSMMVIIIMPIIFSVFTHPLAGKLFSNIMELFK